MNRYDFEDQISAYLDNDLSIEETKEFEKIMDEFPDCREKYLSIRSLVSKINNLPKIKARDSFVDELNMKIAHQTENERKGFFSFFPIDLGNLRPAPTVAFATVAVILLFTSIRLFDIGVPSYLSSGDTTDLMTGDISEVESEEDADTADSLYIDDENTVPNTKINLVKGKN